MIKKLILLSILLSNIAFAVNIKIKSPFLINQNALPHLTKLIIKGWDNPKLALTKVQKDSLLIIRKSTIIGVKKIKKQLIPLESKVVEAMIDRKKPIVLDSTIDKIAKLKVNATKLHLKCISDTLKVLEDEQVEFLLPFGDY